MNAVKQMVLNKFSKMLAHVASIPQAGISPEKAEEVQDELMPLYLATADIYTNTGEPLEGAVLAHKELYEKLAVKYENTAFESMVFTAKWMVMFAEIINEVDFQPHTSTWVFFKNNEQISSTLSNARKVLIMACREVMVQSAGVRRSIEVFKQASADEHCPDQLLRLLRSSIEDTRKKLVLSIENKVDQVGDELKDLASQVVSQYESDLPIASLRLEGLIKGFFEYLEKYIAESGDLVMS